VLIFIGNANIAIVLLLKRQSVTRVQPQSTANIQATGTDNLRGHDGVRIKTILQENHDKHTGTITKEFRANADIVTANSHNPPIRQRISKKRKSSTKLLLTISIFFLLTTLPYCIYAIVKGRVHQLDEDGVDTWRALTFFFNILLWSNFSFNFFLYFVSGSLFKQEWKILIEKIKSRLI
jgi:hypothetical protein